ncbi:hypothetical protein E1301_Tti012252 [Triplophysa tibetana]|uniref:Uncharacterized protein n=1 Tax=Triplophysa tibetana TaxID=1572043 RepID=A0A5A9P490_9TELE|nr:hypothetical protein E1301_Tti012252 [Triplophysa tibetana]
MKVKPFWSQICEHINHTFNSKIPCNFVNVYLSNVDVNNWRNKDKSLLWILLAAGKKTITRKWLKPDLPTIDEWINIIQDIYKTEKLSFTIRSQRDMFYTIWTKWTEYVKHVRSDFV